MVGNHSTEIINHWECGSPQRSAFVTLFRVCRKFLLNIISKCCKHQHWTLHLFLEDNFTNKPHQNQPWKQWSLVALPS